MLPVRKRVGIARAQNHRRLDHGLADDQESVPRAVGIVAVAAPAAGAVLDIRARNLGAIHGDAGVDEYAAKLLQVLVRLVDHLLRIGAVAYFVLPCRRRS